MGMDGLEGIPLTQETTICYVDFQETTICIHMLRRHRVEISSFVGVRFWIAQNSDQQCGPRNERCTSGFLGLGHDHPGQTAGHGRDWINGIKNGHDM